MVVFLDRYFQTVGHKRAATEDVCGLPQHLLGPELNNVIAQCTGISKEVLRDAAELDILSVEARLAWVESRTTTKTEDQAYCLLGIFNVHMPLIYGEGQQATTRLFEEILKRLIRTMGGSPMPTNYSPESIGAMPGVKTVSDDLSQTINLLQGRIAEREMQHGMMRHRKFTRSGRRNWGAYATMLEQYQQLANETLLENMTSKRAAAFWNPLEHMAKEETNS